MAVLLHDACCGSRDLLYMGDNAGTLLAMASLLTQRRVLVRVPCSNDTLLLLPWGFTACHGMHGMGRRGQAGNGEAPLVVSSGRQHCV